MRMTRDACCERSAEHVHSCHIICHTTYLHIPIVMLPAVVVHGRPTHDAQINNHHVESCRCLRDLFGHFVGLIAPPRFATDEPAHDAVGPDARRRRHKRGWRMCSMPITHATQVHTQINVSGIRLLMRLHRIRVSLLLVTLIVVSASRLHWWVMRPIDWHR
jgi:hypothetical protein